MSDLAPPAWAADPSKYPSAGESESVRQAAIRAATFTSKRRLVELARKATFVLSPAQKRQIPIVAGFQQNADAEVFASYYTGLGLAVACATTFMESKGLNLYGADPASSWMNAGPFGVLWEHVVTEQTYKWFGARVDQGYTSNGVGQKQLTSRSLQKAADVRGGCWVPEHNCAEGDVFFLELIRQSGSIWEAAYHYNGSGPAAVNYANQFVDLIANFRAKGIA